MIAEKIRCCAITKCHCAVPGKVCKGRNIEAKSLCGAFNRPGARSRDMCSGNRNFKMPGFIECAHCSLLRYLTAPSAVICGCEQAPLIAFSAVTVVFDIGVTDCIPNCVYVPVWRLFLNATHSVTLVGNSCARLK